MRLLSCLARAAVLAAMLAAAPLQTQPAFAGEAAIAPADGVGTLRSDPCSFYRGQAYGRGLTHVSTEMLWACEAIAARRSADMTLSERLVAVDMALDRYREAVISAGAAAFSRERGRLTESAAFGSGDAVKAALAESTGVSAALDAVRDGF